MRSTLRTKGRSDAFGRGTAPNETPNVWEATCFVTDVFINGAPACPLIRLGGLGIEAFVFFAGVGLMRSGGISLPLEISLLIVLGGCLVACGGSTPSLPPNGSNGSLPAATTTLQAETGNNTSTADSFVAQTSGNVSAGNV